LSKRIRILLDSDIEFYCTRKTMNQKILGTLTSFFSFLIPELPSWTNAIQSLLQNICFWF